MSSTIKQNKNDISSLSNFDEIKQLRYNVDLFIDFDAKKLSGNVEIEFNVINKNVKSVFLDNMELTIFKCQLINKKNGSLEELKYVIHTENPFKSSLGTPLEIMLPENIETEKIYVKIDFETKSSCDGLLWLNKEQTETKNFPYVFSQCQAILCRSVLPCQDTPNAKVYFDKVSLTVEEGINALFGGQFESKENVKLDFCKEKNFTKFIYTQKICIQTYLFAFAAGEIMYQKVSERCGVYAEKGIIDKAVKEFNDMEVMLKAAEEYIDYPYIWGDYNILFLPQGFPYGGMENPNITFLNQALLVGDKSMAPTIAHEMAHSWTGNLVTNKDWNNFWMNEGFTVFLERKIMQILHGQDLFLLESNVGMDELTYAIKSVGETHNYSCMHPHINDENPDDAFSVVPYEKGFNLLYYIEQLIGDNIFRDIFRKYIKEFAFKSVEYMDFRNLLESELKKLGKLELISVVDWDSWIYKPGKIPIDTNFSSESGNNAKKLFEDIINSQDLSNLTEFQKVYNSMYSISKIVFLNLFLNNISGLKEKNYELLKKITNLNEKEECNNAEINYTWFQVALKMKDKDSYVPALEFVSKQGRMKYIRPVFIQLYRYDRVSTRKFFDEHKFKWHSVPVRLIESEFEKIDKEN